MTPAQLDQLWAINTAGNAIPFEATPSTNEGDDVWKSIPPARDENGNEVGSGGDWVCRDYTQWKAEKLREAGWPLEALTVILCWTEPQADAPSGGYHAVLGVCAEGDWRGRPHSDTWILDNRAATPYQMSIPAFPYRWDRRQVPGTTELVSIAAASV